MGSKLYRHVFVMCFYFYTVTYRFHRYVNIMNCKHVFARHLLKRCKGCHTVLTSAVVKINRF